MPDSRGGPNGGRMTIFDEHGHLTREVMDALTDKELDELAVSGRCSRLVPAAAAATRRRRAWRPCGG